MGRRNVPGRDLEALAEALAARYGREAVDRQMQALREHGNCVDDPDLWLETALRLDFKFMSIERVERCPCGSEQHERLSRFVYWNLLAHRRCAACGLVFVSPRLTSGALRRVFGDYYVTADPPEFWGERRIPIFRDIGAILRELGCRSFFDVGSAYGHFLAWAEANGFAAEGCELSETATAWARDNLDVRLHAGSIADVRPSSPTFDAVTCVDTLYYVPDLHAELRHYRDLLEPGGYLVLRLRNCLSARRRAEHQRRRAIGRPALPMPHLWAFTPRSIAGVLEAAGFETVASAPAAYSRTGGLPAQPLFRLNRVLQKVWAQAPVFTRSFNLVARRVETRCSA